MHRSISRLSNSPLVVALGVFCGLGALFGLGLWMRLSVLEAQYRLHGADLPFTLESALEFRYVRMFYDGAGLPEHDAKVQAPEGVDPRATYTIAAEPVYAGLARLLPKRWSLTGRVRFIAAAWFCLGIPWVALWLWWWLRSLPAAGIGAAYYAVGLASVMRSTGQELSHENFALPLLVAALACNVLAEKALRRGVWLAAGALSALFLALALMSWDLIQFYIFIWVLLHYVRLLRGSYFQDRRRVWRWVMTLAALLAAALLNPYLRAHAFVYAPAILFACGMLPALLWPSASRPRPKLLFWVAVLLPPVLGWLGLWLSGGYGEAYGHFGELLFAKLRFLNQKPANPAWLTFDQRILWVPALNSVNWGLTKMLFPATIAPIGLSVVLTLLFARRRADPEIIHLLVFFIAGAFCFWLFMRFHVFLALAAALLLGWLVWWSGRRRWWWRAVLLAWLLVTVYLEGLHTLRGAERWGAHPGYLAQKRELLVWLRDNVAEDVILANFGISAYLLAYGDYPIVLHPKFETMEIRERVRQYGEHLFKQPEQQLRDWADRYQARYYVYSLGEFADYQVDCQMRYFVDALDPPPAAAARLFEYDPRRGRYFVYLWGNAKYRLFRIVSGEDERTAAGLADRSRRQLERGALDEAESLAQLSLMYDPHNTEAARAMLRVDALR
ncbi:MAG: hypothetical protein ABR497_07655 [Kiritimatiellia bacterium]